MAGMKKPNDHAELTKVERYKNNKKYSETALNQTFIYRQESPSYRKWLVIQKQVIPITRTVSKIPKDTQILHK